MENFTKQARSKRVTDECDSSSSDGRYYRREQQKDLRKTDLSVLVRQGDLPKRWNIFARSKSSVTTQSTVGNNKRGKTSWDRASAPRKQLRLAQEIANEVCFSSETILRKNCHRENFSQNSLEKEEKSQKAQEVLSAPTTNASEGTKLVNIMGDSSEALCGTKNDKVLSNDETIQELSDDSNKRVENLHEEKLNNYLIESEERLISRRSLSSDEEEHSRLKVRKQAMPEEVVNRPIKNQYKIIGKMDKKVVLAEFRSKKFLEDIKIVYRVLKDLLGLKHCDYHGVTADKRKETYAFLIYEDALLEYQKRQKKYGKL